MKIFTLHEQMSFIVLLLPVVIFGIYMCIKEHAETSRVDEFMRQYKELQSMYDDGFVSEKDVSDFSDILAEYRMKQLFG